MDGIQTSTTRFLGQYNYMVYTCRVLKTNVMNLLQVKQQMNFTGNFTAGASDALLKPSSVLGRQTATQKHVMWEESSSITTTTTSSLLSGQHKPAASTNGHAAFKLPTFEPTTSSEPLPPPTDITKITTTTTGTGTCTYMYLK